MIWVLCYIRLSYREQTERAIGQIYVSITTNDFHMVNYQIQQVFLYKGSHSKMCNKIDKHVYIQQEEEHRDIILQQQYSNKVKINIDIYKISE